MLEPTMFAGLPESQQPWAGDPAARPSAAQHTIDQLAIQMADWVDENVTGLSQREAEGLETEFKRLVALLPHHDAP